ncbi:MAG: CHASE2 domain-containing protein [Cyanobacteria bacterium]|jgi:signal transduction histidine kinase|nr:CHASE2 domain-containing protein [Cyanobacteria bacterium GSL.Bin1]
MIIYITLDLAAEIIMSVNAGQLARFTLSLSWGLFFGFFISIHPFMKKVEVYIYDYLIQQAKLPAANSSIILVKANNENLAPSKEKLVYANLVERLLEGGASVVVLNLHHSWRNPDDNHWLNSQFSHRPLRALVQKYSEQLVLVTPIQTQTDSEKRQFKVYNHLLNQDLKYSIAPPKVQGFFEYNFIQQSPIDINSAARRIHLNDRLIKSDNLEKIHLESFAVIAFKKYARFLNRPLNTYHQNLLDTKKIKGINFGQQKKQFTTLSLSDICGDNQRVLCQPKSRSKQVPLIRNNIVIVGFTKGDFLNTMPIQSPGGETIPAIELQAYLLANLMTDSFFSPLPQEFVIMLLVSGGILITSTIMLGFNQNAFLCLPLSCWSLLIGTGIAFGGLTFILFSNYITIPIMSPILTGLGCGAAAWICQWIKQEKDYINQQQLEIEQHIANEQQVALSQAQKILYRVGDELHSGALQELKLLMDDLELLQLGASSVEISSILEKAEKIGTDLRLALYDTHWMAQKLHINSELNEGLLVAIKRKLKELESQDNINIKVIQQIQFLPEPINNQLWIEAREEIFQFFNEAISNVIYHALPPHGTATYIKVALSWQTKGELVIENDGVQILSSAQKSTGYGSRLMESVATKLPQGHWERNFLFQKKVRVRLVWEHRF